MRLLIILLLLFVITAPCFAQPADESSLQVWKVGDRRWTIQEEAAFGKWVEQNITEDFFIRYKIPIDCADVPYAIRWIYARIAHLPAAATTKHGKWIGHWSTDWGNLPTHSEWSKDLRFREALLYMLEETNTRTLPLDTYPVRINRETIIPGTVLFEPESHAGIISRIILDGSTAHPLQTWQATSPVKLRKLIESDFLTTRPESTVYSGLVKFRWPIFEEGQWKYLSAPEHPEYSVEQYTSNFTEGYSNFLQAVAKKIDPKDYDPKDRMKKALDSTVRYVLERVPIVLAGHQECDPGRCPEGSELWEEHSTPGRDGRIILLMDYLHTLIDLSNMNDTAVKEMMEGIIIPIQKDQLITFYHIYQNYLWLSPNPEDSIEARWGFKKCERILSQLLSAQHSIAFIEKRYKESDPDYADFSVRQQQELIRRLVEEQSRSHCQTSSPSHEKDQSQENRTPEGMNPAQSRTNGE